MITFTQTLAAQQEAMPALKGMKDIGKRNEILNLAYERFKWTEAGVTKEKFITLTVRLARVLALQVMADDAQSGLQSRLYGLMADKMRVYIRNMRDIHRLYLDSFDKFGQENTGGIIKETDKICAKFRPDVLEFRKAVLGVVVYQGIKHAELMAYAIFAEKLAAVASQYTSDLIRNRLDDFPPHMKRYFRLIDFRLYAKVLKTIRKELERHCGHVDLSHTVRMNVALKKLTTKIDNIKKTEDGKYITV